MVNSAIDEAPTGFRELVENCRRLTVAQLLKHLGRPSTAEPTDVRFRFGATRMTLTLVPSEQHFGGVRWWFICPGCGARRGVLLSPIPFQPPEFLCRTCYNLSYASQLK